MSPGPKFTIKLPIVNLAEGVRGLVVSATVAFDGAPVKATIFCNDGNTRTIDMEQNRARKLFDSGPWVFLTEVAEPGSLTQSTGLVGPNGQPI